MCILQTGGRLFVAAASGTLADQLAFGASHPFRAMRQTVEEDERLGFRDDVFEKAFYAIAARLSEIE